MSLTLSGVIRTHLKNRILVQDRGGAEFQTGGILLYVEDLKRGTNKEVGPKDIFEMGSKYLSVSFAFYRRIMMG
jgi:hypothetical protein